LKFLLQLLVTFLLILTPILLFQLWEYLRLRKQRQYHKAQLQELDQLGKAAVEEVKKNKTI
jgi:preprotein translocase subunit YajC